MPVMSRYGMMVMMAYAEGLGPSGWAGSREKKYITGPHGLYII